MRHGSLEELIDLRLRLGCVFSVLSVHLQQVLRHLALQYQHRLRPPPLQTHQRRVRLAQLLFHCSALGLEGGEAAARAFQLSAACVQR